MPWAVRSGNGDCPFEVYVKTTGKKVGCHPTKAKAAAHVRALYANTNEFSMSSTEEILNLAIADTGDRLMAIRLELAGCSLDTHPEGTNWVQEGGGLPEYICEVARGVMKSGHTISQSIAIAVGQMKNWAHGKGDVNPDTRAKAAKALAEWTALKTKARAKPNK
jgi:hypothetical protein